MHIYCWRQVFTLRHFLCFCVSGAWSDQKPSTADDIFPLTHYVLCAAKDPTTPPTPESCASSTSVPAFSG